MIHGIYRKDSCYFQNNYFINNCILIPSIQEFSSIETVKSYFLPAFASSIYYYYYYYYYYQNIYITCNPYLNISVIYFLFFSIFSCIIINYSYSFMCLSNNSPYQKTKNLLIITFLGERRGGHWLRIIFHPML